MSEPGLREVSITGGECIAAPLGLGRSRAVMAARSAPGILGAVEAARDVVGSESAFVLIRDTIRAPTERGGTSLARLTGHLMEMAGEELTHEGAVASLSPFPGRAVTSRAKLDALFDSLGSIEPALEILETAENRPLVPGFCWCAA